jgi:hypothetical protein
MLPLDAMLTTENSKTVVRYSPVHPKRSDVLTVVNIKITVICNMTPCSLVYKLLTPIFRKVYEKGQQVPSKILITTYQSTRCHIPEEE